MGAGGGDERACATSSTLSKRSMSAFLIWWTKSCVAPLPCAFEATWLLRSWVVCAHKIALECAYGVLTLAHGVSPCALGGIVRVFAYPRNTTSKRSGVCVAPPIHASV